MTRPPEPRSLQFRGDLRVEVGSRRGAEILHRHAGGQRTGGLHIDGNLLRLHDGRVDEVDDGTRVMNRQIVEALDILVVLAEGAISVTSVQ